MAGPQTLNPRLQFPVTFSFKKLLYPVPLPAHLMKSVHTEEGEGQLLQCADWLTVKCPDSAARSVHRQQTRARHSRQCVWWTEALKLQRGLWHRTPPVRAETHLVISLFPPTASEEGVCVCVLFYNRGSSTLVYHTGFDGTGCDASGCFKPAVIQLSW